ncbi:YdeI/OmpD-associated family protein [uncultured Jatrophihabitans sp.]|uniref:YdeI/OmpD-associated family protein n=1 Tax=uncultured Jatrophihabitans sp. TaxID=1610747 RepID=UPI0035CC2655
MTQRIAQTQRTAQAVEFTTVLETIGSSTIARLPQAASACLPSRGQVAVRGSVAGHDFRTVLEPDGARGHWLRVDEQLQHSAGIGIGDHVAFAIEVVRDWPEPDVPGDLAAALSQASATIQTMWTDITPMARWEWVRWVNATANPATRRRRVEVTISKMTNGKRRPCCFDLSACTDPTVSKSGKLLGSA